MAGWCRRVALVALVAAQLSSAQEDEVVVDDDNPRPKSLKCAGAWKQCGGNEAGTNKAYSGPTCCGAGYKCVAQSEFYSQCTFDESQSTTKGTTTTGPTTTVQDSGIKGQRPWDYIPKPKVGVTVKSPTPAANPIVVKGNFLYDSVTQKRFYVKGLCYNPNPQPYTHAGTTSCKPGKPQYGPYVWGTDLITDEKEPIWREDLKAIADLGVNVIRLYDVDPEASHEKFMAAAAQYGIYIIVPLTRAKWGFMPAGMASPDCYTGTIEGYGVVGLNLLTSAKLIVKQFSKWDNTLFFTVGNEVETSHKNGYAALPCVKALTRDIHMFQDTCVSSMRRVPLMYAATDVGGTKRKLIADYMMCELDTTDGVDDAVDVHGLNVYSWCDFNYTDEDGNLAWDRSPYYEIQRDFHGIPKPLIFSEFDCHEGAFHTDCPYKGGRTWPQLEVMTKEMAEYLSGGLAFEYSMEDNEFGLILKPGYLEGQDDLRPTDSYYALQEAYTKHDIASTWDGKWDDSTRCTWSPSTGPFAKPLLKKPKFPVTSTSRACPKGSGLQQLFSHQYDGSISPTWHSLPPRPETNVECPNYQLSKIAYAENCCSTDCSKVSSAPKAAAESVAAAPEIEETLSLEATGEGVAAPPTSAVSVKPTDKWVLAVFQVDSLDLQSLTKDEAARVRAVLASVIANVSTGNADRATVTDLRGTPGIVTLQEVVAGGEVIKTTMVKGLVALPPDSTTADIAKALGTPEARLRLVASLRDLLPGSPAVGADLAVANVAVSRSGPENANPIKGANLRDIISGSPESGHGSVFPWWGWLISSLVLASAVALVLAVCLPAAKEKRAKRTKRSAVAEAAPEEAPPLLEENASAAAAAAVPVATYSPVPTYAPATVTVVQPWQVVRAPQQVVQVGGYVPVAAPVTTVRYS